MGASIKGGPSKQKLGMCGDCEGVLAVNISSRESHQVNDPWLP